MDETDRPKEPTQGELDKVGVELVDSQTRLSDLQNSHH